MSNNADSGSQSKQGSPQQFGDTVPQLTLPKGGGAIHGIGEKFSANPVTGTGSMSIPLPVTPSRSGFSPQLSLSYDSGSGNGPFGFGWSLALPSITRKTDKGLPQYFDFNESDVFLLSGAEDLMPALVYRGGNWTRDVSGPHTVYGNRYLIHRYRPRVESLFARIERWINTADPQDSFWRSIAKDDTTIWYGKTAASRIADPADPTHIFNWLICETCDAKGNAMVFEYKPEDSTGVDTSQAHERNRTDIARSAKRYIKRVSYGNQTPYFPDLTQPTAAALPTDWHFEVVFDYGGQDLTDPLPTDSGVWTVRLDPFSSYRSTFEIRTYRLCRRVLMFHHFADEQNVGLNCLVRSTTLRYAPPAADPTQASYSYLISALQTGYVRDGDGGYTSSSLPPVEFEYSQAVVDETVRDIDRTSLENLPYGLEEPQYRWIDLDGEGLNGFLSEQSGSWFYKANLSAANQQTVDGEQLTVAQFAAVEVVDQKPSIAALSGGRQRLMDVSGHGKLDLVVFDGPTPGFYERTDDANWRPFRAFSHQPVVDWNHKDLRFIDLTGDGFPDVLISEDGAFVWHNSLSTAGFAAAQRVPHALDEEKGPQLVFSDSTETIFLADVSGDGLTDLVRIRNGEFCYWPNIGYGRFGAKVTMDQAPRFDRPELFDARRIRLADIDGSGTADVIYVASGAVHLYFNQSGNAWGTRRELSHFPSVENVSSIAALDLLGNGTACLVWSSPLSGNLRRPMRYIDLMGGRKPHLLVYTTNNLGADMVIQYAPSTKFYVADKIAGTPWVTRLPFPVHVVEQVQTYDYVSRNLFVSRYAYHHGYYDGIEREFRGFGRVDQWDTAEFATLSGSNAFPTATNVDTASQVPPVYKKTWMHTGAFFGENRISKYLAQEYYSEPGLTTDQANAMAIADTVLPNTVLLPDGTRAAYDFSGEELREACRALRGSMLRQETYALDGGPAASLPYNVSERNYTIEAFQPRGPNLYGTFFAHARENIEFRYERQLFNVHSATVADPRVTHEFTLDTDAYGNVLQSASVGYGRRYPDASLPPADQAKQSRILSRYMQNTFTNAVLDVDSYRTPVAAQASTYELLQIAPGGSVAGITNLFAWSEIQTAIAAAADGSHDIPFESVSPTGLTAGQAYRRLIGCTRTYYRPDDMGAVAGNARALLPLGSVESRALSGASYKQTFTPGLLAGVYLRGGTALLPTPAAVLASSGPDGGGYVDLDGNGNFWMPSGRSFYLSSAPAVPQELNDALQHFFLPVRFEDAFGNVTNVAYDGYDSLAQATTDPAGNTRSATNDYRCMAPAAITDPNGNQAAASFDALGFVAATAMMGKSGQKVGDSLTGFSVDVLQTQIDNFYNAADPHTLAAALLGNATSRIIYDVNQFYNTRNGAPGDPTQWLPPFAATITRETHVSDLGTGQSKIQIGFSYSDGFGREIQRKVQAEPGSVVNGGPIVSPRWVSSGWTIFNNKGKPVRKYEPFFSQLAKAHQYEFGAVVGISPILCYDPLLRTVATIHANHTYEKAVFDPWQQATWDVNDTVAQDDPTADSDVGSFFVLLPAADYSPTWRVQRAGGALGVVEQQAAAKALVHANTPSLAYLDALGRTFLTVDDNGAAGKYAMRTVLDIQNKQRSVSDALGREVITYDYDMLGQRLHQSSMEAGEQWTLNDALGKGIRAWDNRGHNLRTEYDTLRRQTNSYVLGSDAVNSDPRTTAAEVLFDKVVYGEGQTNDQGFNLRAQVYQHFDAAGVITNQVTDPITSQVVAYDFKGNLLGSSRQFLQDGKALPDWSKPAPGLAETWVNTTRYDALNRTVAARSPDGSTFIPTYNEASLLETASVKVRGATTATEFISNINYDAKAQRVLIEYGSAGSQPAATTYSYDPLTFRLVNVVTTRPGFSANQQTVQDLSYTYDPVGNVTHIQDDADLQNVVFFNNRRVEPSSDYTYDAIYRLTQASGREQLGTGGGGLLPPAPSSYNDVPKIQLQSPGDGNVVGIYDEQYQYDSAGNLLALIHTGSNPANPGWTRAYSYGEPSALEPGKLSNRLSSTAVSGSAALAEPYTYDWRGNMTSMPQLQAMQWDFMNRLLMTQRQAVNSTDADGKLHQGERTYYVYNANGERVRKLTEAANGTKTKERFYLGAVEIYREYDNAGATTLERQTLHVMDDKRRIALVESTTVDVSSAGRALPAPAIRYQFDNLIGSASLELDDAGALITYEEYYPFGSTSYQAGRSMAEVSLKRYRYTAKERDEETGLYYNAARYYASWLGRWTAADPAGLVDGVNLYQYARCNPVRLNDPTGTQSNDEDPAPAHVLPDVPHYQLSEGLLELHRSVGGYEGYLQSPFADKVSEGERSRDEHGHAPPGAANLQWLTFGNTPGGFSPFFTGESELGANLAIDRYGNRSWSGTATTGQRFLLQKTGNDSSNFHLEGGILTTGTFLPGQEGPNLVQGMLHGGNDNAGLFLVVGGGPQTGLAISTNIAFAYSWGKDNNKPDDNDPNTLYGNLISNAAERGTEAGKNVTSAVTGEVLGGYQRGIDNLFGLGAGSIGIEGLAARNISSGNTSSNTYGGNLFLNASVFSRTIGIAAGATYETNGGGTNVFLRFGIALDSNGGGPLVPVPIAPPGSLVPPMF